MTKREQYPTEQQIRTEQLLRSALHSDEVPDAALKHRVKFNIPREETELNKVSAKRPFSRMAVAILAVVLVTTTALAAWITRSPAEVADHLSYPLLAEAFRSDDALLINETQTKGGYRISFLGIVSGSGLTGMDAAVEAEKSYAVVAISKEGGDDEPGDVDLFDLPFFVSPLIHGQIPWQYNIASMHGGYHGCVIDNVLYRLIECSGLEMFADRGLSLIVSSTFFYSVEAYDYDESTGLVTPNPDFEGVNLLFDLPLDPAKADYDRAQATLDSLWEEDESAGEPVVEGESDFNIILDDDSIPQLVYEESPAS